MDEIKWLEVAVNTTPDELDRVSSRLIAAGMDGLVPRAEGKRYAPVHLAYLTAVCALKKVLSVRDISNLIHSGEELGMDAEAMYGYFLRKLDQALTGTAETIDPDAGQWELAKLALTLALQSYAYQLACARILDILEPADGETSKKPKK